MESSLVIPNHIAMIMDGNRRWARKRGLPTQIGHSEGAKTMQNIAEYLEELGVKYMTVYAFSTENWKRSKEEVDYLMQLLEKYIREFDKKIKGRNIRLKLVGDIEPLPKGLQEGIREIEERTKNNTGLTVNVAINYGGRAEIVNATKKIAEEVSVGALEPKDITEELFSTYVYTAGMPDPDLVIRTGGEIRSSGFLTWQSVYSEFYYTECLWPDFGKKELDKAIAEYNNRKRNFGK
ncbi:MAG: isoprenyl transferase [Clostridia bacterium]|nr:isoprenyl transferase [Clostridia bacterium]